MNQYNNIMYNPFEQFLVTNHVYIEKKWEGFFSIFNHEIYINDTLIICVTMIIFFYTIYMLLSFRKKILAKGVLFNFFRSIYEFIYDLVSSYLPQEGRIYFPFFFYLFIFIALSNLIGILPYSFTITSHLTITFALSFTIWFGCTIIGFVLNGLRYFSLFFPRGVPFALIPFLVGIEVISYIFRSVSLALRLFANIVAGHILLDTLALFIHNLVFPATITLSSILISILPFIMCIVLILFELVVAILQAYIFLVLSCIYLKDVYNAQSH
jgi:F-type H+-transporting ATPase subunit a